MNKRFVLSLVAAAALTTSGCGSDDKKTEPGTATGASLSQTGFRFSTGKFEVTQGDRFECFYTDTITDRQLNVRAATGRQGPGGHHITVYYTDQKAPVGHHECENIEMIGLHQIAGATDESTGTSKEGIIDLPEGYATKVPAGKQLVIQSHYIHTDPKPMTVEDTVNLVLVEEKDVKEFVNAFVLVDADFKIPPRDSMTSSRECTLTRDFDLLLLLGHMHEWGSHYKLERVDESGKVMDTIYEQQWEPLFANHPPVNHYEPSKPLHLTKGTKLRQTCSWTNVESEEMVFPREMCVMFSYYVHDEGFIVCDDMTAVKK